MESLSFLFGCLSLSEKGKRTFEYEDEGMRFRRTKSLCLAKSSESKIGLQNIRGKNRLERSDRLPKVDVGVSPLLKGNGMEVYKDVEANARNLPRDKSKKHQRRTTHPESNHASVQNSIRFKNLSTGKPGKGKQLRQPNRGNCLKNLVATWSDLNRMVDLEGSKPNVTVKPNVSQKPMKNYQPNVIAGEVEDLRSLLDSRRSGFVKGSCKTMSRRADSITYVRRSRDLININNQDNFRVSLRKSRQSIDGQ